MDGRPTRAELERLAAALDLWRAYLPATRWDVAARALRLVADLLGAGMSLQEALSDLDGYVAGRVAAARRRDDEDTQEVEVPGG